MEIFNDDRKDIDAVVDRIDRYRVAAGLSMYMLAEKAGFSENTLKYIYKTSFCTAVFRLPHSIFFLRQKVLTVSLETDRALDISE